MKKPFFYLQQIRNAILLIVLVTVATAIGSCSDDDDSPVVDPDAPTIIAPDMQTMKGGEAINFSFSVTAPGTISAVQITATAGTASVTNQGDLIGTNGGQAQINYVTTGDISGSQSVTLTIEDEQGKSTSENAQIEVFAPVSYGMAIVSGAGDVTTTFLQGLPDLEITEIDNSNSTELAQFAAIYTDGNALLTAGFGAPATMGKYVFNSAGEAGLDQEIIVPGSNSFSSVEVVDQNRAYATVGGGISRAVEFNPSDMRITNEIDLSDAGDGLFYSDMIVRDNNLFIALNDFGASGEAKVAVVDLQTNTLEKVITDDRTATLFGTLTTAIIVEDSNGDLYFQGSGLFSGKPSGILKINAGETDFDTNYFFDLTAATGSSCFGLYYFGDNETFTTISENDDNWFGFDGDNPSFRYRKINLAGMSDGGDLNAVLPNTFAASRTMFMVQTSEDEILFPIAGTDEDALYSYTISSGVVAKKITSSSGYVSGLVPLD